MRRTGVSASHRGWWSITMSIPAQRHCGRSCWKQNPAQKQKRGAIMAPLFTLSGGVFSKLSYFCRTALFARGKYLQKVSKTPRFVKESGCFLGGDCWTRTSDLLRVKNCVMSNAGGHSRCAPRSHRPFAAPQVLKLYTATSLYSLKSPTYNTIQYLVTLINTVQ